MTVEELDLYEDLRRRESKLRDAVREAGLSVMETSGKWSIHGVREHDKLMEAEDLATVMWATELQAENEQLRKDVDALLHGSVRTSGEARIRLGALIKQPAPERRSPRKEEAS